LPPWCKRTFLLTNTTLFCSYRPRDPKTSTPNPVLFPVFFHLQFSVRLPAYGKLYPLIRGRKKKKWIIWNVCLYTLFESTSKYVIPCEVNDTFLFLVVLFLSARDPPHE
jgi:hypothetical protein